MPFAYLYFYVLRLHSQWQSCNDALVGSLLGALKWWKNLLQKHVWGRTHVRKKQRWLQQYGIRCSAFGSWDISNYRPK